MSLKKEKLNVSDMYCTSCEGRIEKALSKLPGVTKVKASYTEETVYIEYDSDLCSMNSIHNTIIKTGYGIKKSNNNIFLGVGKILGLFIIIAAVFILGNDTSGFDMSSKLKSNATYLVLFIVGLFTSIHCVGMCGGIMLSQTISAEGTEAKSKFASIKPALQYNLGRVISYTILGGIIGALGSAFSISLKVKSGIMLLAGLFMILMGINMAGFKFLRSIHIKLPWAACKIKSKSKAKTPFVVGLLNGLLPCGPLQTMQLFALGTGNALKGASSMFVFAIGTVPLMLSFGAISGLLSKGYTKKILKFSGVLVVVLGIVMSSRGLALAGINLPTTNLIASSSSGASNVTKSEIKDGIQTIKMVANYNGYEPNVLYVQKGIPVKLIVDGQLITSCNNQLIIPSLGIEKNINKGETVIEFTPKDKDINFSCWMGMIRGIIKVVDDVNSVNLATADAPLPPSTPSCCAVPQDGSNASPFGNVPASELVKKAVINGSIQSIKINGSNAQVFDPPIIVVKKGIKAKISINLSENTSAEGKYEIIDGTNGNVVYTFQGKKGTVEIAYTFNAPGGYGIIKGDIVLGVIEVVDDMNNVNLEEIRSKYLN